MRRLVNESLTDRRIRTMATRILDGCPDHDFTCHARKLRAWLGRVWRFVRDPHGVELLYRPQRLLDMIEAQGYATGDCDDVAILGAALAKAVGFPARFVLLGFGGPSMPYQHVYTEIGTAYGWVDLDVTQPQNPPSPTQVKRVRV